MKHKAAVRLIAHPHLDTQALSHWADLGCGRGTFTKALADLLGEGSKISAVDEDMTALQSLPATFDGVPIEPYCADFVGDAWPTPLDGILMANSLHFVSDQLAFLRRIKQSLKATGKLILVEYDTAQSNPWVPYPHSLRRWQEMLREAGFDLVEEIARQKSAYGRAEIVGIWAE